MQVLSAMLGGFHFPHQMHQGQHSVDRYPGILWTFTFMMLHPFHQDLNRSSPERPLLCLTPMVCLASLRQLKVTDHELLCRWIPYTESEGQQPFWHRSKSHLWRFERTVCGYACCAAMRCPAKLIAKQASQTKDCLGPHGDASFGARDAGASPSALTTQCS